MLSDIIERALELQREQAADASERMRIEIAKLHRLIEEDAELRAAVRLWTADGEPLTYPPGHPLDPERPQLGDPVRDAPLAFVEAPAWIDGATGEVGFDKPEGT